MDKNIPLTYKNRPLRRKDDLIYYGTMAEKYIVMLQVMDKTPLEDITVAKKIKVQLQLTDPNVKSRDVVVKTSEKGDLFSAMDIASIWLERALAGKI